MKHLGRKELRKHVAVLLASGKTFSDAAATVGISRSTIWRWMKNKAFANRVDQLRDEAVSAAVASLSTDMIKASRRMAEHIDDPDPRVSLAACKALLQMALKARAAEEMERKIQELDERLDALTKAGKRPCQTI